MFHIFIRPQCIMKKKRNENNEWKKRNCATMTYSTFFFVTSANRKKIQSLIFNWYRSTIAENVLLFFISSSSLRSITYFDLEFFAFPLYARRANNSSSPVSYDMAHIFSLFRSGLVVARGNVMFSVFVVARNELIC